MAITTTTDVQAFYGKTVSLSIHPAEHFQYDFSRVQIVAIVPYSLVDLNVTDAAYLHRKSYSSLPSGIANTPDAYDYALLKFADGTKIYLGVPYIIKDSISLAVNNTYTISITDDRPDFEVYLSAVLTGASINSYTISKD